MTKINPPTPEPDEGDIARLIEISPDELRLALFKELALTLRYLKYTNSLVLLRLIRENCSECPKCTDPRYAENPPAPLLDELNICSYSTALATTLALLLHKLIDSHEDFPLLAPDLITLLCEIRRQLITFIEETPPNDVMFYGKPPQRQSQEAPPSLTCEP